LTTNDYAYSHTIVDTLLLLELTNYKIFKRELGYQILLIPILFWINPLIISSIIINYVISVVNKISSDLDLNIFMVKKNKELRVFCSGVFDLCHLGHMTLFKKIHESFNQPIKLIVGIHSDFVCKDYKRSPIINENIRYRTVELCKYVDEIIPDCPLIISKEFMVKNRIDVVIIGEEYKDSSDKKWYPGAFELNNYKYISRFDEISSSDIIKKIKSLK
jgi:cytidyltransferase-like protein